TDRSAPGDPLLGRGYIAGVSSRFITHIFRCSPFPAGTSNPGTHLTFFIASVVSSTGSEDAIVFHALALLLRLKELYPTVRARCGHRLFLTAFMVSSKFLCDQAYSNVVWRGVAGRRYSLRVINQMERDLCRLLRWDVSVRYQLILELGLVLLRDFRPHYDGPPRPTYTLAMLHQCTHFLAPFSKYSFISPTADAYVCAAEAAAEQVPRSVPIGRLEGVVMDEWGRYHLLFE
ncbi:hypothetical protein B0H16DRAFT_1329791, partial [Mycena metata]